jgi:hypothetical protein
MKADPAATIGWNMRKGIAHGNQKIQQKVLLQQQSQQPQNTSQQSVPQAQSSYSNDQSSSGSQNGGQSQ